MNIRRLPVLLLPLLACSAAAQIVGLGAAGASLTDEYFDLGSLYSYAHTWVEQLVTHRGVNFGRTAAQAGQPNGTWGEPRRRGYEFNWARSGDDSGELLAHGQHTGLAAQAAAGEVSHVVFRVSENDVLDIYSDIYEGLLTPEEITLLVDAVLANTRVAVDTVAETGVGLVIANMMDVGKSPIAVLLFPDHERRAGVREVFDRINAGIRRLAHERRAVLVDYARAADVILGTHQALNETLLVGNFPIRLREWDTTINNHPEAAWVHDLLHPHTQMQGILANFMLTALNGAYDAGVPLFSEEEILAQAGLPYGGMDTLAAAIGEYGDYVFDFTRLGDLNCDGAVNAFDIEPFLTALFDPGAYSKLYPDCDIDNADLNGDGAVDAFDIEPFLRELFP